MAIESIKRFILTTGLVFSMAAAVYGTIENYDDKKCIKDNSLPDTYPGNYHDCNTPEAIQSNRTSCCVVEDEVDCCDDTGSKTMLVFGFTVTVVTLSLMAACFIVFWCEPRKIPFLRPCISNCCPGKNEYDDDKEMSNIAEEMRRVNKAYIRGEGGEFSGDYKQQMPEELKGNPVDNWWGDMPSQNTIIS